MVAMLKKSTQDHMEHTYKTFQALQVFVAKIEIASRWILYSSVLCLRNNPSIWSYFLHRLSRILKVNIKWLRGATTYFSRQNAEPGGRIQIQVNPGVRQ